MSAATAIDWLGQMLWTALLVASPLVLTIVVIGLLVAIAQAATQVNDAAVAFAPKLVAALICLAVAGEWMLLRLRDFAGHAIEAIARLGPG